VNGLDGISAQRLSDTIGAIYDCALDPQRWNDAIRRIVELCDSAAGGMCVHDLRNVEDVHLFEIGYTKEFSELIQTHYQQSPLQPPASCTKSVMSLPLQPYVPTTSGSRAVSIVM